MSKITVHMTKEALYDFLLYHAYSKFSGFLINILGFAVIFLGVFSFATGRTGAVGAACYLIAAAAFIGYTPMLLKIRAKKQVEINPEYKGPVEYIFSEEDGITARWEGGGRKIAWSEVTRAAVAPKTIGIYYGKEQALIFPKQDFGEEFLPVYQMIVRHLAANSAPKEDVPERDGEGASEKSSRKE